MKKILVLASALIVFPSAVFAQVTTAPWTTPATTTPEWEETVCSEIGSSISGPGSDCYPVYDTPYYWNETVCVNGNCYEYWQATPSWQETTSVETTPYWEETVCGYWGGSSYECFSSDATPPLSQYSETPWTTAPWQETTTPWVWSDTPAPSWEETTIPYWEETICAEPGSIYGTNCYPIYDTPEVTACAEFPGEGIRCYEWWESTPPWQETTTPNWWDTPDPDTPAWETTPSAETWCGYVGTSYECGSGTPPSNFYETTPAWPETYIKDHYTPDEVAAILESTDASRKWYEENGEYNFNGIGFTFK